MLPVICVYSPAGSDAFLISYWWSKTSVVSPKFQPAWKAARFAVADQLVPGEALVDPAQHLVDGPGVDPADEPEGEEVLGAVGVAGLDAERRGRLLGERGHRHLDDPVPAEGFVRERVAGVAGLREVALVEGVGVDDERPALLHPVQLVAQCGRVHGDEHVRGVARRRDVVVRDVDLEGRHPGQGSRRGPDLGRELGQRGQVVAHPGADAGEAVPCELHPVAGVPGEADDHGAQGLWRVWPLGDVRHVAPPPSGCHRRLRRRRRPGSGVSVPSLRAP